MDRRKQIVSKPNTVREAIRALLKKEEAKTANKVLLGIYQKGWTANQKGQYRSVNPYPNGTPYWEEWNRGWTECSKIVKRRASDALEGQLTGGG